MTRKSLNAHYADVVRLLLDACLRDETIDAIAWDEARRRFERDTHNIRARERAA